MATAIPKKPTERIKIADPCKADTVKVDLPGKDKAKTGERSAPPFPT